MAKIIGNTTTTPMIVPDLAQTNSNKADFVKNKKLSHFENDMGYVTDEELSELQELIDSKESAEAAWEWKEDNIKFIENQPIRTIKGQSINLSDNKTRYNKIINLKLHGKTERATEPTFDTPCNIVVSKYPILMIGDSYNETYIEMLCEGDYIEFDFKKRKVLHYRTKTKWVATEESIRNIDVNEYEIANNRFVIAYNKSSIEDTEMHGNVLSNFIGEYYINSGDEAFYVYDVINHFNMGDAPNLDELREEIKDYLTDKQHNYKNPCVLYIDLDEPIITDITSRLGYLFDCQFNETVFIDSGTVETSYIGDINNVLGDMKQENKGYVDQVVGDINAALDELHQYALSLQGGSAE